MVSNPLCETGAVATNDVVPSVRDALVALFHPRVASEVIERALAAPARVPRAIR